MGIMHKYTICDKEYEEYLTPTKAIRKYCIDCSGGSVYEVTKCEIELCPLWPFRFGKAVGIKKRVLSEERKKELAESLKKARAAKLVD